ITATDTLFVVFLALSGLSALFATNHWLAQRALGLSVSSALVFWATRRIARQDGTRGLLIAAALATVVAAASALLQAYGVDTDLFTLARAPGGTLGNRNFIAHICAIGLPSIVWCTVTARREIGALVGSVGMAIVSATLVLSRSRAAWLALLASLVILALLLFASRKYWSREIVGGRLARLALAGSIGAILSVTLPNSLHWTSDSPYLDSARGVVDYTKGSGGGRVAQYRNSLKMAVSHPIFGVGPGNWPVRYVQYAPRGDRSITDDNTTANPWPSSDWVAFVSERGLIATLALLGVFGGLFVASIRKWKEAPDPDAVLLKIALAATITAAIIVSCFDAALLLAAPAFLVWGILGAASGGSRSASAEGGHQLDLSSTRWSVIAAATMIIVALSVARSATETTAMTVIGYGGQTANWARGAAWDPGSYRINARVAELYANRGRCAKARPFAKQAARLFPSAVTPKRVLRRCG
ncbi:MAG TPA: O-antigen ligase family protein, partial [Gemmatimonadaceae bacterium]|nr:O-antigen ligase family protein [Gemmatimonadaceae bacterium]